MIHKEIYPLCAGHLEVEKGILLGPYNTSDSPITIVIVTPYWYFYVPVVPTLLLLHPIKAHYCYCCALILLLLCRL